MVLSSVPLEPLFVDRTNELVEFDRVLVDLAMGRRQHLALLGLRRIGKTLLLDEVRRRHPNSAIAYLALDEVVSSPEDFARALAGHGIELISTGGTAATLPGVPPAAPGAGPQAVSNEAVGAAAASVKRD